MVKIQPDENSLIPTERILKTIDEHADETALLLLPGIQYYSGQFFDMPRITAHAKAKYITAGPGSIAGAFVHEKHGKVEWPEGSDGRPSYRPRLMGWYGGDKSVRFLMDNKFVPTPGAQGYQASNPSAIDLASLSGPQRLQQDQHARTSQQGPRPDRLRRAPARPVPRGSLQDPDAPGPDAARHAAERHARQPGDARQGQRRA